MQKTRFISIIFILFFVLSGVVSAQEDVEVPGVTVQVEGIIESVSNNAMYVNGKVLLANQYSAINTGGTNLYVGDYVMALIYLNEDYETYTIVSLSKDPARSIGTPTPILENTATPAWQDLFTPAPDESSTSEGGLTFVTLDQFGSPDNDEDNETLEEKFFSQPTATPTPVPTSTPSSISFSGVITKKEGVKIVVDDQEYITDNNTNYKDNNEDLKVGDYVNGRAAPFSGVTLIRFIEVVPDYDRPDAKKETIIGLVAGQDKSKLTLTVPEGDKNLYFYSGTKMSKSFYTKGAIVNAEVVNDYVMSVIEYPLITSGEGFTPMSGKIEAILELNENEIYFIADKKAYFIRPDAVYNPDKEGFVTGALFVGLLKNGQVDTIVFTRDNHVKTINGNVSSVDKSDPMNISFVVNGTEYYLNNTAQFIGNVINRNTGVYGFADSGNKVFYLTAEKPWYADLKDLNWSIIIPAVIVVLSIILFLLLHKTKISGYLMEVNGNILTISDSHGDNPRHYVCVDEIARYAGTMVTMKVEAIIYHGKVVHISYEL